MARVGVLRGNGINAEAELAEAFRRAGGTVAMLHVEEVLRDPACIRRHEVLAFPGGFSYGDHLGSGLVLAHFLRSRAGGELDRFVAEGGLVLGICNGFQVLVRLGMLPNLDGSRRQSVSLVENDRGVFVNVWVPIRVEGANTSPWLDGLSDMELPVRHGEGRLIAEAAGVEAELERCGVIAFRYGINPNGSLGDIAGLTDHTGRVLGLMPHPEAFLCGHNHPRWRRETLMEKPAALRLFENGVRNTHRLSQKV